MKVTLARDVRFDSPVMVRDAVILASGSDAVWFTFPGRWHDIGRFHLPDDTFTGIYANILTPPVLGAATEDGDGRALWRTTDLFLDVWIPRQGGLRVLDREQLDDAEARGWVNDEEARRAREEVEEIRRAHAAGAWPPAVVRQWTLERARAASETVDRGSRGRDGGG